MLGFLMTGFCINSAFECFNSVGTLFQSFQLAQSVLLRRGRELDSLQNRPEDLKILIQMLGPCAQGEEVVH